MKHSYISKVLAAIVTIVISSACGKDPVTPIEEKLEPDKVLILYSAGYNSLSTYLYDDIQDLKKGWLPGKSGKQDVLLIYTHTPSRNGLYSKPTNPYLIRMYKDEIGLPVTDTLVTFPQGTISSSAEQLNTVLDFVRTTFPSHSYGMIFSSHATGYLPSGYYSKPSSKSIGQDLAGSTSYEMELTDFAAAFPMKMDYILFDACLMGGVEVAYELKDVCSRIGFSQAEVLAEGLNYKNLTRHLLQNGVPNPQAVCEDYFSQYNEDSGLYRSATISLIDCRKMEHLAQICKNIFNAHRDGLKTINPNNVQRFFRESKHWFYDLESIIIEAGASETELTELRKALNECVLYKGHTPEFMGEFKIEIFSGLSMYLPCNGSDELNRHYRTLLWNKATELVEY